MRSVDVIVVGAGAAGLMCAATAAERGRSVLVIDHADQPGKKIRISGGGRCNFTNLHLSPADYLSANPHFCKSALARFTQYDFLDIVERYGIAWHERDHGQLFCNGSAAEIVDMLLDLCRNGGAALQMATGIRSVARADGGFRLDTNRGTLACRSLVVASGGLSLPKVGASGFGHAIARQFGLGVLPTRAGLVPFTLTGGELAALKSLAGISLDVTASCNGQRFREAMLFTHRGLSGPAMLQISSYWQPGGTVAIDLLPAQDVQAFLRLQRQQHPQAMLLTALGELLPKRLVAQLAGMLRLPQTRLGRLREDEMDGIAEALHCWQIRPAATEGYRTAEVTVGGVDTGELSSKTMEARKVPGLYFIGEVVDVTGHLGGFNFQWAWSSGHCAGLYA